MPTPARPYILVLILLSTLALAGCGSDGKAEKAPKSRPAPVAVAVAEVRDLPVRISAVGAVQAASTVSMKTQVGGLIVKQFVRDGQEVKAGDMLFQIDPRPFAAAMAEARAQIERNQVLLAKAELDLARYTNLKDRAVISQDSFDQTKTDADALRATIRLYEAQFEAARLDLEHAAIRAPISGVVGEIKVTEGNVIKANDDRNLVVINQVRPISVAFAVPEQYLPEIARRMRQGEVPVSALPTGDTDQPVTGRLDSMDNSVDSTTGTIRLKATFANADSRLWPGQFARATVELGILKNAVVAPSAAIQTGINGPYLYVVAANSTAELRQLETGLSDDGFTVVKKGLAVDEKVVVDGYLLLTPGASVVLKTRPAAQGAAAPSGKAAQGAKP